MNNGYSIRYEVSGIERTEFVIAPTAMQALMEGKERVKATMTPEQLYSLPAWRPTILEVTPGPLCPYCAEHAYRKCKSCETLMCGCCGGVEPVCHECLASVASREDA